MVKPWLTVPGLVDSWHKSTAEMAFHWGSLNKVAGKFRAMWNCTHDGMSGT